MLKPETYFLTKNPAQEYGRIKADHRTRGKTIPPETTFRLYR